MRLTMPIKQKGAGNAAGDEGSCVASGIFALFLLAGALVLWGFFLEPFWLMVQASGWVERRCTIVSSAVEAVGDDAYRPSVRYKYEYDGASYGSGRIWFIRPDPTTRSEAQALVNRYPAGSSTICFVNPQDAKVAVLERGFKPALLIAVFPLAVALIGLVGLGSDLRSALRRRLGPAPALNWPWRGPDRAPGRPRLPPPGPVRFRSPGGFRACILSLGLAVFWNGMVWFLVREVIGVWREGLPGCHGWLLTFFALPFVVMGIALVVAAGYFFFKLFHPRLKLKATVGAALPGESIPIIWRFSRRVKMIRRLRVYVEGREEATYARGGPMYTDREVFATIALVDTRDPEQIRRGQTAFVVGRDVLPSFESKHNRIVWAVCVAGEIRRWPDVTGEVEVVIQALPAAGTGSAALSASQGQTL